MGNKLREYRRKKQMTQKALADASGVSRATICALEKGRLHTSTTTLIKIADALNTKVEKIFF